MSVYVDNARIPARVGRIRGRWSHLISDNPDLTELHTFAAAIGLRRAWFQPGPTGRHPHYDLTETKRAAAIAAGAVPVSWHQVPGILAAARAEPGTPRPRVLSVTETAGGLRHRVCRCGAPLTRPATGRWPRHCSPACRQAAYRARHSQHRPRPDTTERECA